MLLAYAHCTGYSAVLDEEDVARLNRMVDQCNRAKVVERAQEVS
jgi:hypothetical protein